MPLSQLLGLGISGGIVPCPAALVVLLFAISTSMAWAALVLVLAFSVGLAGMLVGIGVLMVTSRQVLDRFGVGGEKLAWALRLLPPLSAICVAVVGLVIAWKAWTQGVPGI